MSLATFYSVVLHCIAKHCPPPTVAANTRISTNDIACDTVVFVSCDDGFAFPDGSVSVAIECIVTFGDVIEAVWNVTELDSCQRESVDISQLQKFFFYYHHLSQADK
jgi:hypothetical protein